MSSLVTKLGELNRKLSKPGIVDLARKNADDIIQSKKYDLLTVYIELKRYETYLKELIARIKTEAYKKATEVVVEQPKTTVRTTPATTKFEYDYAKVNISTRTVYDFSSDPEWKSYDDQIKVLTIKKKEREKFLKEHHSATSFVDKTTGEVLDKYELPKEVTRGLTIQL